MSEEIARKVIFKFRWASTATKSSKLYEFYVDLCEKKQETPITINKFGRIAGQYLMKKHSKEGSIYLSMAPKPNEKLPSTEDALRWRMWMMEKILVKGLGDIDLPRWMVVEDGHEALNEDMDEMRTIYYAGKSAFRGK